MEVHQLLVAAAPGDAVTDAAFEQRAVLRERGESQIFARHIHDDLSAEVAPLAALPAADDGSTALLFHVSIGDDPTFEAVERWSGPLVVSYHNITPAEHFDPIDPAFAALLRSGRRDLARLAPRPVLTMADSAYNAAELTNLGYDDVRVCPLVVDVDRLRLTPPDGALLADLERLAGPRVLFVGQQLPHKRPDLLISAIHILTTYLDTTVHLLLVGAQRSGPYADAIRRQVRELGLDRVHVAGWVSEAGLVAHFRAASVFCSASEHEGYGIPPLQAMAFDVPVVARACAAVPEVVGDGGLLLPPDAGPAVLAEALHRVICDPELADSLARAGRSRLATLTPDAARCQFRDLMAEVA